MVRVGSTMLRMNTVAKLLEGAARAGGGPPPEAT